MMMLTLIKKALLNLKKKKKEMTIKMNKDKDIKIKILKNMMKEETIYYVIMAKIVWLLSKLITN